MPEPADPTVDQKNTIEELKERLSDLRSRGCDTHG